MIKNTYETIMMYILYFIDIAEKAFIEYYPVTAGVFSVVVAAGVARGIDRGTTTAKDAPTIIIIALIVTIISLVWALKKGAKKC